jgi:DNA primase
MSGELETYRHPSAAFELPLPAGWEHAEDVDGCALIAVEPARDDPHFRANVVVTIERLGRDAELEPWAERSLDALRASLERLRVIDLDTTEISGLPARRALTHYVHGQFGGINLEQWSLVHGGLGFVVSCSTAALGYDDLWLLTNTVAEGLRVAT